MKRAILALAFALSLSIVQAADTLRVMTFNVRLPVKGDGVNYWDNRHWALYRGGLKPVSVETITDNVDDRYPSDHFPVLAVFEWQ